MAVSSEPHATLADIDVGDSASVSGFTDNADVRKLARMGFVPGSVVSAIRVAPLGDPIEYSVMGGRVAMRRSDAVDILVHRT